MKQIIYTNKQGYSETHIFDNSGSIVSVLNSDAYQQVSLSVTPEKTNEVVNYIAFAFVYGYNENEMTVDNAEVNISPLIQSSEDSKNETSEKEAVDEEVLSESIDKSKPYMQTSSEYDNTGNYVTSETNEQGSTTKYSYDTNGNPLSYRDGMSFEWENGRILKKINTSDKSVQMSYDSNGMRTQKTVDGVKTNYYYDSNKNLIAIVKGNDTLLFYYDSDGSATSFSYNGTMYFYVKNLQGDVVRIIDLSGTEVASYVYDAWGNIKDTKGEPTIRELNPIRYRGYVYDTETGLYYLQSRYYDSFAGRFLNADDFTYTSLTGSVLSSNLYSYCENNSINNIDNSGYSTLSIILNIAGMILSYASLFSPWKWFKIIASIAIGMASAVITIRDYNNQIKKLNKQYNRHKLSEKNHKKQVNIAKFWMYLGLVAAGITVVCGVLSIPAKFLMRSVGVTVINALGFAKGMVLSRAYLIYDLTSAFYHKRR